MPIEALLSDALRESVGPLPGQAGDWPELRARGMARHRQGRVRTGIALATVAALVVGLVAVARTSSEDRTVATAPGLPSEVVASIDGRVVVLSAADGRVVRTLSESAPNLGATRLTVTPDGETVYVQRGEQCGGEAPSIWRMPTSGGPAYNIGPPGSIGMAPLVSPDGRWLAYAGTASAAPGDCGPFDRLIVQSLAGGDEHHLDYTPTGSVVPIGWNPDSTRLVTFLNEPADGGRAYAAVSVSDAGLADADRLAEPAGNGYEFLPTGEAVTAFPTETSSRIATFDVATGSELRVVTEVAAPLYLVDVDRAGESFLLEGPLADAPNGHDLYRATIGEREPVRVASNVNDVVWLPSPPLDADPPVTTTTTTAPLAVAGPDSMMVATGDRRLEVRDAGGAVVRFIGAASLDYHRVALAPDGQTLYYEQGSSDLCGAAGEIGRVRIHEETLNFEFLAGGSWMALGPDGTKLAYRSAGCAADARVVVRDLTTGDERSWVLAQPNDGGPSADLVGPDGWDADGRHLMLRVNREPSTEWWYVDTATGVDTLDGPVFFPRGEQGFEEGPSGFVPLPTAGRWVAVYGSQGDPTRLVQYDVVADLVVRPLVDLPGSSGVVAGVDLTGRHLLVVVDGNLYRWSEGDPSLTLVAEGVTAADW